jgi:hypothetical protein
MTATQNLYLDFLLMVVTAEVTKTVKFGIRIYTINITYFILNILVCLKTTEIGTL